MTKMLPKQEPVVMVCYFLFSCICKLFVIFIRYEYNNCGKFEISIFHNVSYVTVHFPIHNLAQPEDCLIDPKRVFNVIHVRALYHTKTLITNKCKKRVSSSIVTHQSWKTSFVISVCTHLLGYQLGPGPAVHTGTAESSRLQKQRSTQSTAHSHSTIKCNLSVR
jgi:hypothetical protein